MKKVSGVPLSLRLFPHGCKRSRSHSPRSRSYSAPLPNDLSAPLRSRFPALFAQSIYVCLSIALDSRDIRRCSERRASTYVSRSLSIRFSPTCAWKTMTMLSLLVGKMFWRLSSLHSSLLACREGCRFPSICTLLLVSLSFQRMPKRKWTRWMKNGR